MELPLVQDVILPLVLRIGTAVIIMIIGRWLARTGQSWLHSLLVKTHITETLIELFERTLYYGILFLAILLALTALGVPVATLLAGVGLMVIILGIALQESLANFAATIIFLLFQPIKVGEIVETCNVVGTVTEIQIFNTVITTFDHKIITLPNGGIQASNLVNYTRAGTLRADIVFSISYRDEISAAKRILADLLTEDKRVLYDPMPTIVVQELGDNSVDLAVRPWVKSADYWDFRFDFREQGKVRLEKNGILIPFPQRDVHIFAASGSQGATDEA